MENKTKRNGHNNDAHLGPMPDAPNSIVHFSHFWSDFWRDRSLSDFIKCGTMDGRNKTLAYLDHNVLDLMTKSLEYYNVLGKNEP